MANNTCCPTSRVSLPRDHGSAGSARPFLQRLGLLEAVRLPSPRMQATGTRPHTEPLWSPLPLAELLEREAGPTTELLRDPDLADDEELLL